MNLSFTIVVCYEILDARLQGNKAEVELYSSSPLI